MKKFTTRVGSELPFSVHSKDKVYSMKSSEITNVTALQNNDELISRIRAEVPKKIELVRAGIHEYRNWKPDGIGLKKGLVWCCIEGESPIKVDGVSSDGKKLFLSDGSTENLDSAPYSLLPLILNQLEAITDLSHVYEVVKGTGADEND